MRRILTFLMTLCLLLSLTGCGNSTPGRDSAGTANSGDTGNVVLEESTEENTSSTEEVSKEDAGGQLTAGQPEKSSAEADSVPQNMAADGSNVLVVYFSATGTTETLAKYIAESTGADIYRIEPGEPYTQTDLNYNDRNTRATVEQNDKSARPEIAGSMPDMEQYQIIFIGYPIWWGEEPRIMDTFVESVSLTDKTVVPFCTSGGSGMGNSAKNMESLADGGQWLDGERLKSGSSRDDMVSWVNSLGLPVLAE